MAKFEGDIQIILKIFIWVMNSCLVYKFGGIIMLWTRNNNTLKT